MDSSNFASLLKAVAGATSRRGAIAGLLAGGVLAGASGRRDAGAKGCRRLGGRCRRRKECCGGAACNKIDGGGLSGDRCCSNRGAQCTRDCDCCLSLACVNRRCG